MDKNKEKNLNRIKRHKRVRAKITGTSKLPRVAVFKSNRNIFIQIIDDVNRKTILSSKIVSVQKTKAKETKTEKASAVGEMLAKKAVEAGIKDIVFDRGGFKYHGRIKAVAEGLRKGGLKF